MSHDHDPDFTNPKLNGAQPMSDTETIAEVLAAHSAKRPWSDGGLLKCSCGERLIAERVDQLYALHRAHLAAALEHVIREREKKAWDAGFGSAQVWLFGKNEEPPTNPYDTKEEA